MDAETEAGLIAAASAVCAGNTSHEIRWKVPLVSIGFWAATAAKRNGNRLVGRRPPGAKIMERLEAMMDQRLKEVGHARTQG